MTTAAASQYCGSCQKLTHISSVVTVQAAKIEQGKLVLRPRAMYIFTCGHCWTEKE